MKRYVVEFEDGNFQLVWAENKKQARKQMQAFAACRNTKIVMVSE